MIHNATRNTVIARTPWLANSVCWRMRGMIGRGFNEFDALIFKHTNSIHMFFMAMPLDILFLRRDNSVMAMRPALQPWRMAMKWGAATVVELPIGTISASKTECGDQLQIQAEAKR